MATSLDNGGWNVSLADANEPGQIQTISQGLRSMTISYTKLNSGSIYTKDTGAVYPLVDVQGAMSVVASIKSTNGIGGTTSTAYTYGGLRVESGTGRGMLGFRWMQFRQVETDHNGSSVEGNNILAPFNDPIEHIVDRENFKIYNITLEGHQFYPGQVEHTLSMDVRSRWSWSQFSMQQVDAIYLTTVGTGSGPIRIGTTSLARAFFGLPIHGLNVT